MRRSGPGRFPGIILFATTLCVLGGFAMAGGLIWMLRGYVTFQNGLSLPRELELGVPMWPFLFPGFVLFTWGIGSLSVGSVLHLLLAIERNTSRTAETARRHVEHVLGNEPPRQGYGIDIGKYR